MMILQKEGIVVYDSKKMQNSNLFITFLFQSI